MRIPLISTAHAREPAESRNADDERKTVTARRLQHNRLEGDVLCVSLCAEH